jgi:hypothetical protein
VAEDVESVPSVGVSASSRPPRREVAVLDGMGSNGNFTVWGQNGSDDVGWFKNDAVTFTGAVTCRLFTLINGANRVPLFVRYSYDKHTIRIEERQEHDNACGKRQATTVLAPNTASTLASFANQQHPARPRCWTTQRRRVEGRLTATPL